VLAALALVTVVATALVLLTGRRHDTAVPHWGKQQATFRSADGRIEAAIYWLDRWGGPFTEVVLRPAGATANRDMVSFGCTEDDDGLTIVAVTVRPDSVVTRNSKGEERTIRFDPRTLRPEATLGSC
jgi:hypothetical protein